MPHILNELVATSATLDRLLAIHARGVESA
jgi:hypothetical protein